MARLIPILIAIGPLWLLWIAFTGSTDPQELGVGLVAAILVAIVAGGEPFSTATFRIFHPKRFLYALAYVPYLAWAIVRSNLDVARRVLSPSLPINPGIVRVRTRLTSPVGRTVLANSITLTPGTLTVDICDDELCIHWVDVQSENIDEATREIVSGFEKYLEVIFG